MGKIKYKPIPTETSWSGEKIDANRFLKFSAICAIFLIFMCYSWPLSVTITMSHSYIPSNSTACVPSNVSLEQTASTTEFNNSTQLNPLKSPNATLGPNILDNYFVYTSRCRMPALNPFAYDAMRIFQKTPYSKCDTSKDLITVLYNEKDRRYTLHMNEPKSTCCYKTILRTGVGDQADNKYNNFHQDFLVPKYIKAVITECRRRKDKKFLQRDAFSFVQPTVIKSDVNNSVLSESIERRPSVLLWGIDSISRMNFQRTMPLMYKYLKEENWYELQGYNKMGDNTYPNLMAILTGFNNSRSMSICRPKNVGGLDACPMLWKAYKKRGYVTAYAEDWDRFSTFNYNKKGFIKPPTDYYPRPLMLALEKEVTKVLVSNIPYCVGRRHYAEYIYDFAVQFSKVYKNESSFGMFWTNSFSHNNFSLPSTMDAKILEYMQTLHKDGTFENSIILFFSDHGMRFGPLRSLDSGFLEERLPIMYIWLPNWFKQKYPAFAYSLQLNKNRLTSPYDIYATLKHVLELETPFTDLPIPEACPSCHSLFYDVAESRNCQEAGITNHWCSCSPFKNNSRSDKHIKEVAQQLVLATNEYLVANNLTEFCQTIKLTNIESVQRKYDLVKSETLESYLVRYEVEPRNALFEASTYWNRKTQKIVINVPDISRLDAYSHVSKCIEDNIAKKFCICFDELILEE